jgi:hypothetical protein
MFGTHDWNVSSTGPFAACSSDEQAARDTAVVATTAAASQRRLDGDETDMDAPSRGVGDGYFPGDNARCYAGNMPWNMATSRINLDDSPLL